MTNRRIIDSEQSRAKKAYAFVDKVNKGDLENIKKFGEAKLTVEDWKKLSTNEDLITILFLLDQETYKLD